MTRAQCAEITEVRARLVAAAKSTIPVTRRAAAQLRDDLATWQRWTTPQQGRLGDPLFTLLELPRFPRRIRVALDKKTAHGAKPKKDLKNKLIKCNKKPTNDIDTVKEVSRDGAREIVSSSYDVCRAIAMRTIGKYRLAEDCVSESMVSALEQIAAGKVKFASADKVAAWICQIVRYNAARVLRTLTNTPVGDILPSRGILPSYGRQGAPPGINEQAEPPDPKWADDKEFRTVGVSKRCLGADDQ